VDSADDAISSSGDSTMSQYAILAISLLVTTVVGYVNFMNPAQRWQQLRGTLAVVFRICGADILRLSILSSYEWTYVQ
jgi:hypothetical protein